MSRGSIFFSIILAEVTRMVGKRSGRGCWKQEYREQIKPLHCVAPFPEGWSYFSKTALYSRNMGSDQAHLLGL